MTHVSMLLRRMRGSFRSDRFERSLDAELRHHLDLETEANVRRGMPPEAARDAARRTFGSIAEVKDDCRDSWGLRTIDALTQDVRFGARTFRKYPGYTAVVLLTLGLGIGANTAVFSVVHAVLLRSLPYAHGDALVEVRQDELRSGIENIGLSPKEILDYRTQTEALDAVVEYHQMYFNLLGGTEASRVQTGVVSADFFDVLGVKPILGRTFVPADDVKDAPPVLVLSHGYWMNALGGDPHVVGRTFEMNDRVHTVVGVLPDIPQYPQENDVYMPSSACPFRAAPAVVNSRTARMLLAIGRLRPGATLDRARGDLSVVSARLAASYPKDYDRGSGYRATALSVHDELTKTARPTLLALLAVTTFVLVLVCANVANLTLARLVGREREIALRTALGAGRGRIARQLLTESLLLSAAGGVLGIAIAYVARSMLVTFTARFTPRANEITIDGTVLMFALGVSLATGLVVGLIPAAPRRRDVADDLREGAQRSIGGAGARARHVLVAAQVAISFVLLVAAGLMVRSFINLERVDAGFNADHVLTMRIGLDWSKYNTFDKRRGYFKPLLERVAAEPGIKSAGLSLTFPLDQTTPFNANFVVEGRPVADGQPHPQADFRLATSDYFKTIGMQLLRGRSFTESDDDKAPPVAIVNLSMARHFFGEDDPVGRRVSLDNGEHWTTIVGMVNDVRQYGLDSKPADELYLSFFQRGALASTLLVRTAADPMSVVGTIQRVARSVDPNQPISGIQTLEDVRRNRLTSPRVTTILISLFAIIALIITAAGIAGVVSFSVNQRTTEIGVRMALGAEPSSVVRLIVRQALTPVAAGLAIGVIGSIALTRPVSHLLFAVEPTDPVTFAIVLGALAAVAFFACAGPASRAAAIAPMQALRAE